MCFFLPLLLSTSESPCLLHPFLFYSLKHYFVTGNVTCPCRYHPTILSQYGLLLRRRNIFVLSLVINAFPYFSSFCNHHSSLSLLFTILQWPPLILSKSKFTSKPASRISLTAKRLHISWGRKCYEALALS